jgi:serine/threonine protein phosphatase PrpC
MSPSDTSTGGWTPNPEELAAKYFGPPAAPVCVDFGALSHPGKVRANNEDHYAVVRRRRSRDVLLTNLAAGSLPPSLQEDTYTLIVADGMGGHACGEVASMMALHIAWGLTDSAFKWHFKLTQEEAAELTEMVRVYGQVIHRKLQELGRADPRLAGMGTTLTAVLTAGLDALVAHVGDSRAYLFRAGVLQQLTRDHTLAQQLVDRGVLPSVASATGFMRRVLTNCLGGTSPEVRVETYPLRLADGDRLLLCTDGLTDMLSAEEIRGILAQHPDPQQACGALVDRALEHGGKDNVTVVLARYVTSTTYQTAPARCR